MWGPSSQSVFIRDCQKTRVVLICQQLRMRDCHDMEIMLFAVTDPIIESSSNIKFLPFNFGYTMLKQQMAAASLNLWNNNWSEIYDFTPAPNSLNYSLPIDSGNDFIPTFEELEDDIMRARSGMIDPS